MMRLIYIFAVGKLGTPSSLNLPDNSSNTSDQIGNIINIVYTIAAIVAIIAIIVAGMQYSLSNGNSQTVSKAKNAIIYSVVGLVLVASAFMITNYVIAKMG